MKIAIAYPPLKSEKGIPLLGQNRQFQWAKDPWTAYPMVSAYAATLLKQAGHQVVWLDGISRGKTYEEWEEELLKEKPDLIMIETKTPVIKKHWEIITELKEDRHLGGGQGSGVKIVLVGDHVTALPEESMENCPVDYILTGGDYDFLLLNLVEHLEKEVPMEPGIWYRVEKHYMNTGHFLLNHDLNKLPFIDRDLTKWELYAYQNSNYARKPGTYTMFGRDCWWGKCTFCSWTTLFPGCDWRSMTVQRALDEIGYILEKYPVKEIMDDSGTFPVGDWLKDFCEGMIKRGYNQKIKIDCNMRFNSGLTQEDYNLMAKAGFRFLLYGLESANQKTLDRLNKNLRVEQITTGARMAKKAGLWPHVTAMVGYPWETKEDAMRTLELAKKLFQEDLIDSLQATVVIPYPGTPLFKECQENNWLKTTDWDQYDMKEPIMKTQMSDEEILGMVRSIYSSIWSPQFIARKIKEGLSNPTTFKYYASLGWKFFSKKMDFGKRNR